jgi:acetyl/propionyl-CoA carboxylase alpha subunit
LPLYFAHIDNQDFEVEIEPGRIICNGEAIIADLMKNSNTFLLKMDTNISNVYIRKIADLSYEIWIKHYVIHVMLETELTKKLSKFTPKKSSNSLKTHIRAPMPGLIKEIEVKEGECVEAGTGLIVLEAMKMENEIHAPISGVVKQINVEKHNTVEKNQLLLIIEPSTT